MEKPTNETLFREAKRIIVKVDSGAIIDGSRKALNSFWLNTLCHDIKGFYDNDSEFKQVIIVSSGSLAMGKANITEGHEDDSSLCNRQIVANIGQPLLIAGYSRILSMYGLSACQNILSRYNFVSKRSRQSVIDSLDGASLKPVIPVACTNYTVLENGKKYLDNDRLSALVAHFSGADLLVMLSNSDDQIVNNTGYHNAYADDVGDIARTNVEAYMNSGGIMTKPLAIQLATEESGCSVIISPKRTDYPLTSLMNGKAESITLLPKTTKPSFPSELNISRFLEKTRV